LGFLLGIEFEENAADVHKRLLNRKIITGTSSNPKVLRLLPPLCLTEAHVDEFVLATDEN
jgi:acetylornithine/succinyldiaminopimelate/putrescine aminotransferase